MMKLKVGRSTSRKCKCPICNHQFKRQTYLTTEIDQIPIPQNGNPMICGRCGHLSVFSGDLLLRVPTDNELANMIQFEPIKLCYDNFDAHRKKWSLLTKPS
jgi:hypothetical protein